MTASQPTPDRLVRLGFAFREAKALLSAVELDVFTVLSAAGPLEIDELAERTGVHRRAARDFFDALVALDLLERDGRGRYSTTHETARYLDRNSDRYVGGELEFASARQFGPGAARALCVPAIRRAGRGTETTAPTTPTAPCSRTSPRA